MEKFVCYILPMTVDLVPRTLEFMKRLCTQWKARNCVCWPFELAKTVLLSIFTKVEQFDVAKENGIQPRYSHKTHKFNHNKNEHTIL